MVSDDFDKEKSVIELRKRAFVFWVQLLPDPQPSPKKANKHR